MNPLEKITFLMFAGVFIYLWNKYAVTKLIKSVVRLNHSNKWLSRNEEIIIKGYQGFFWAAFGMAILSMILSE